MECKICGDKAIRSYLGVLVCSSCRMFFKRNAEKKEEQLKCRYDGECEVNILNRHVCSACRLKKCFASGMKIDLLRGPISTVIRKNTQKKMTSGINQVHQFPTINLLRSDQSTMTVDQWNLLSNLLHCYDEHSGFLVADRYVRDQNVLPIKSRYKVNSLNDLFGSMMAGAQLLFEKNADFLSLSPHDQSILLHGRLKYVGGLGSALLLRHIGLYQNPTFYTNLLTIYGSTVVSASKYTSELLDHDVIFVKLMLAVVTFSTFDCTNYNINISSDNLDNSNAVLSIQNMYIELAWQYILHKYGHIRAVMSFSNLLRCIFTINSAIVEVIRNTEWTNMVDDIIKRTEASLSLNN
ncbi:hypothetical protein I4U23_004228 [Adineta vaga]|nr:hypothetical protein I4U23_004228 [Adineta vaga]